MSTPAGVVGGLLASAASEAAAFAAGLAIGPTLSPEIEFLKNEAWNAAQTRALEPGVAAEIAAEDVAKYGAMAQQAAYHGVAGTLFADLYGVSLNAPGTGELIQMLRRSDEVPIDFAHGLRKAKLETQWDNALANLASQRLSATDIAYMVVRGVLPDEGLLGLSLPTHADNLRLPPQHSLNPVTEAKRTGWDAERLAMMIARSGLAMAPVMAAQARFRGILTQNDYELTIARGDLFPAYADPVLEVSRAIPSPSEYAEAWLRGWVTQGQAEAGAGRHGMVPADLDLIYKLHGRSMSATAIYKAEARGGTYNGAPQTIPEPYLSAARQSNVRPEWYSLWYADRFTEPSAFVVRTLLSDGAIDAARGATILANSGWSPDLAQLVATHYAGGTTAASDPHVAKAQTQLWTTAHRSYVGEMIDSPTATSAIEAAGVPAASASAVITLWAHERTLIRKQLTPAQVKKAYRDGLYTLTQATDALLARGYDRADATTLLEE